MSTMYEMIMDLPLFKGVGKEHVSSFLEKTNLNFQNFEPGDRIVTKGDVVKMVRFVIKGEVTISHAIQRAGIVIDETCGYGRVLGADRLYGMSTGYSCDVTAVSRTSIMEFSKEQYVRLLNSDPIYLLNFFNFLSRRAQRPVDAVENFVSTDLRSCLGLLLSVLTDPDSTGITIHADVASLASYLNVGSEIIEKSLVDLIGQGLINHTGDSIRIISREKFLRQ